MLSVRSEKLSVDDPRVEATAEATSGGTTRTSDRKRFRNWKRHQRRLRKRAEKEIDVADVAMARDEHRATEPDQKSEAAKDDIHQTRIIESIRRKLIRQVSSRLEHLDHLKMLRAQVESNTESAERNASHSADFHGTLERLKAKLLSLQRSLGTLKVGSRPPNLLDQSNALFGGRRLFSFQSVEELIAIRQEWDAFAHEDGQSIPLKWVLPGDARPDWSEYKVHT